MKRPNLQVIEGGAGLLCSFSDEANEAISKLDEVDREEFLSAFARGYRRIIEKLFNMATVSYSPVEDSKFLVGVVDHVMLTTDKFSVKCELIVREKDLVFRVHALYRRASASVGYQIHQL